VVPRIDQFSPEERKEIERLFAEEAPIGGVLIYKGRKIRKKQPKPAAITIRQITITAQPLKKLRKKAAHKALTHGKCGELGS